MDEAVDKARAARQRVDEAVAMYAVIRAAESLGPAYRARMLALSPDERAAFEQAIGGARVPR